MMIAPTAGMAVSQPAPLTNSTTAITKQASRMPIITRYRRSRYAISADRDSRASVTIWARSRRGWWIALTVPRYAGPAATSPWDRCYGQPGRAEARDISQCVVPAQHALDHDGQAAADIAKPADVGEGQVGCLLGRAQVSQRAGVDLQIRCRDDAVAGVPALAPAVTARATMLAVT